jgi:hypothetical protein
VTNYFDVTKTVDYTNCDGTPGSINVPPGVGGGGNITCAVEGSLIYDGPECTGAPFEDCFEIVTPTYPTTCGSTCPSPSVSPSPSITITPSITLTPTPSPCINCYGYEITNYYSNTQTIYYTNCNGDGGSINVIGGGVGGAGNITCAIENSLTYPGLVLCSGAPFEDCLEIVQAINTCGTNCNPPVSISVTPSVTLSTTPSVTPSVTPTISETPSVTPSITPSQDCAFSASFTETIAPSPSVQPSPSVACIDCVTNDFTLYEDGLVSWTTCNGSPAQIQGYNGEVLSIPCHQVGTLSGPGITSNTVSCGNFCPSPTPTISVTPTITPTPSTPNPSVIPCDTVASYDGGQTYPSTRTISLGSGTGSVSLYYNALSVPDRFIVYRDVAPPFSTLVLDTGYRGSSDYDYGQANRNQFTTALNGEIDPITSLTYPNASVTDAAPDGYPYINGIGAGTGSFNKTDSPSYTTATVNVYAPMSGTAWSYKLLCPVDPSASVSPSVTPSVSRTPSVTPSISTPSYYYYSVRKFDCGSMCAQITPDVVARSSTPLSTIDGIYYKVGSFTYQIQTEITPAPMSFDVSLDNAPFNANCISACSL